MCVYENLCRVGVCLECHLHCTLSMNVHVTQLFMVPQYSVSHCHLAIQQRMMDVEGSATNYPLYTDGRGCPSSSCTSITSRLSYSSFAIHVIAAFHSMWEEIEHDKLLLFVEADFTVYRPTSIYLGWVHSSFNLTVMCTRSHKLILGKHV